MAAPRLAEAPCPSTGPFIPWLRSPRKPGRRGCLRQEVFALQPPGSPGPTAAGVAGPLGDSSDGGAGCVQGRGGETGVRRGVRAAGWGGGEGRVSGEVRPPLVQSPGTGPPAPPSASFLAPPLCISSHISVPVEAGGPPKVICVCSDPTALSPQRGPSLASPYLSQPPEKPPPPCSVPHARPHPCQAVSVSSRAFPSTALRSPRGCGRAYFAIFDDQKASPPCPHPTCPWKGAGLGTFAPFH